MALKDPQEEETSLIRIHLCRKWNIKNSSLFNNNEEKEFVENKRTIDLNKQLKKVGINEANIVVEPRVRKNRKILDL